MLKQNVEDVFPSLPCHLSHVLNSPSYFNVKSFRMRWMPPSGERGEGIESEFPLVATDLCLVEKKSSIQSLHGIFNLCEMYGEALKLRCRFALMLF